MRRFLKITGITLLVILIVLIATPFLFKGKLEDLLKKTLNEQIDATVSWKSLDLSLIKSFPDAALTVTDFSIVNKGVFEGDTLAYGKRLELDMGITQLFKKADDDPIQINTFILDEPIINIKVNEQGIANYDITKSNTTAKTTEKKSKTAVPFTLGLQHYELHKATINYLDESANTFLKLSKLEHEGNGDFSSIESTLSTTTEALVSFELDGTNYLSNNSVQLTAAIAMNLEQQRYTFLKNEALVNALPLHFEGYVELQDDGNLVDLSFETPESDFKNFLAVIPSAYAKNLDGVETQGDFRVSGKLKGISNDDYIPTMDIAITSDNASFQYPSLPKKMDRITINALLKNTTGHLDDTFISINNLSFRVDEDVFTASGKLRNLTTNLLVNLALKGALDLGKLEQVYPLELKEPLSGRLAIDMTTQFDMDAIDNHQYDRIESKGIASVTNLFYASDELPKPLTIEKAAVQLNPGRIVLEEFSGKSGATDLSASGTIENLIPFVMSKEDLKGRFTVQSDVFDLHDFSVVADDNASKNQKSSGTEQPTFSPVDTGVKIPNFLDAAIDFQAQQVIYDDLTLNNVSGTVAIAQETAQLHNVVSDIFNGKAGIQGMVSTKDATPIFDVALQLNDIDIDQSFEKLDLLKGLAPIAKAIQGALTTEISLSGELDKDMSPVLTTIAGDAFAQLLTATVNPEETPLLNTLNDQLDFIDLSKVDLSQLKTKLRFEDGQIAVDPFNFMVEDVMMTVNGGHRFDNTINYNLNLDIPAEYMGGDISRLLAKLTDEERENLSVNLPVSLTGNFKQPKVNVNTQTAISDLTNQIIEIQKQHALDQVNDKLDDAIDDVLGDILGGNKPKDSTTTGGTSTEDIIKDTAGNLFNGIFGGRKKKKTTQKDSVPKGN